MASSSNTAKLILTLIDNVSKPARAIGTSLGVTQSAVRGLMGVANAPSRVLGGMGRSLTRNTQQLGVASGVLALGATAAARAVFDYEKAGNRMQAFGLITDEQRANLEAYGKALNSDFPFSNSKILEAAQELFRAGLTYEQAMGALRGTLNLAMAGDIDVGRATDIATNVMTAMKLPMETFEQVQESLLKVNDALAYAASNSNTDVQLMGDTFRYVAPLAAAAGMSIDEVTAVSMALAKAGIKGSEAGVALRSALVRMAKPTKPMIAAFERLGISMKDFVKYKDRIEAKSIIGSLLADGIEADSLAGEIQAILDDPALGNAPARMAAKLTDLVVGAMGDESLRDKVSSNIQDAVLAGAQDVDLIALLDVLKKKGATITDIAAIFDARMGSRLAAIIGEDLYDMIRQVQEKAAGTAEKTAAAMTKGIVGDTLELKAAMENLSIAIGDSGVLGSVSKVFDKISELVGKLSAVNPQILEFGTYGFMAAAALAPLGFALSGLAAGLAVVTSPITLAVGALGTLVYFKWDGIRSGLQAFSFGLKSTLSPEILSGLDSLSGKFEVLWEWASAAPDTGAWIEWGRSIGVSVGNGLNFLFELPDRMRALPGQMFEIGGDIMRSLWDGMKAQIKGLFGWLEGIAGRIKSVFSFETGPRIRSTYLGESARPEQSNGTLNTIVGNVEGKKAAGGAVRRGMTYEINERGRETVTMGTNGYVTPAHKVGGSVTQNVTVQVVGGDPDGTAKRIVEALERQMGRASQLALDGRRIR